MDKTAVNIRISTNLNNYIRALTDEKETTFTHTFETLLQIGLENRKEANKELEKKRILARESLKLETADATLRLELKKAYLIKNFRKLLYQLLMTEDMSKKSKQTVIETMFKRIEDVFGKESEEYQEAQRIYDNKRRATKC